MQPDRCGAMRLGAITARGLHLRDRTRTLEKRRAKRIIAARREQAAERQNQIREWQPNRGASAEGWPKPKRAGSGEKRREPSGQSGKAPRLHAKGPKPPNENKLSCGWRGRAEIAMAVFS